MVDFTVAICTYNGETRVPEVLDSLRSQANTNQFSWEILVVDNNSTDNTARLIREYQENWGDRVKLKYCFESQQGAAFARKRAIKEVRSPLVGFLDDDNVPSPDWVAAAYEFSLEHPKAGAYGSQIHGDFEVELPPKFERIVPFLAITERGSNPLKYTPEKRVLPPSAGLVVRTQAWKESVPERCILTGRTPGNMLTGEDLEAISYIQQAGWEIWYNPAMQVVHKIPRHRLEKEYLIPFFQGIGLSRHVIRMLRVQPSARPLATLAYMANDLRKIIRHWLKYGKGIRTDLVAACEMELFVSSLRSPLYLWKNGYLSQSYPKLKPHTSDRELQNNPSSAQQEREKLMSSREYSG